MTSQTGQVKVSIARRFFLIEYKWSFNQNKEETYLSHQIEWGFATSITYNPRFAICK